MKTIGIVGLGLIGGSLARDLAAAGWRVQGSDRDPATETAAREAGVIDGPLDLDALDLLVLAVPVGAAPAWLRRLADRIPADSALVLTDVGSTKRSVMDAAREAGIGRRFVGSHPLAGSHRSGWSAGRTGLFRDAPVWVCAAPDAEPGAVERVEELWRAVGARPRRIGAQEHDRRLAHTSHLPQIAGTALAGALYGAGFAPGDLGPGGRDATRLAGSDPELWADILVDNADALRPALDELMDVLADFSRALDAGDRAALRGRLAAGRAWSEATSRP